MIPGFIGFAVSMIIQFRLKYHVDREKVMELKDLSELYPNGLPPRKVLTERGRRLYLWFFAGIGFFIIGLFLSVILFG